MNDFLIFSSISIKIKSKKYANFNSPGRLKRRSLNPVLDTGQMTANGVNRRKGMFPKREKGRENWKRTDSLLNNLNISNNYPVRKRMSGKSA
jgi:hypothetical protein